MRSCSWANITKNIDSGAADAFVVSTTNMHTGGLELFLQKRPEVPHSERLRTHLGRISPRHVMASAALPCSSTCADLRRVLQRRRHPPFHADRSRREPGRDADPDHRHALSAHPRGDEITGRNPLFPPAVSRQGAGKFLPRHALDRLEADRDQLERINRVLAACAKHTTPENFDRICQDAYVHPIETLFVTPSTDISKLVDETLRSSFRKLKSFGILERSILRLLEIDAEGGSDLLSYFLFEPTYLKR